MGKRERWVRHGYWIGKLSVLVKCVQSVLRWRMPHKITYMLLESELADHFILVLLSCLFWVLMTFQPAM